MANLDWHWLTEQFTNPKSQKKNIWCYTEPQIRIGFTTISPKLVVILITFHTYYILMITNILGYLYFTLLDPNFWYQPYKKHTGIQMWLTCQDMANRTNSRREIKVTFTTADEVKRWKRKNSTCWRSYITSSSNPWKAKDFFALVVFWSSLLSVVWKTCFHSF